MGEVYRAHDARLKRDVAVKVIPDVLSREPERLQRLKREAQILASLDDGREVARSRPDDTVLLNNGFLRWSRDGRRLVGVGQPGNQPGYVYLFDPFGQEPPRKLIDLTADVQPRGATWTSDGSSILLGLSKTTGDIILAERSR